MQQQDFFQPNDADFSDTSDDRYAPMQPRGGPPPQFFQNGPPPNAPGFMNGGQPPQYGGNFPSRGRGKFTLLTFSYITNLINILFIAKSQLIFRWI